ncbi:MAG: TIGR04438 family Trp-rich protein [Rubrivivax sp.]
MWLLIVGLVLAGLKVAELGPVAGLSWWWVALPFALTLLWWMISDATGLTARREMDRYHERRERRRKEAIARLGVKDRGERARVAHRDPTNPEG